MDSCARGAFLSGGGFPLSLDWLQAARASNSTVAMKRIRVDRRSACSVNSMPKISLCVTTACYFCRLSLWSDHHALCASTESLPPELLPSAKPLILQNLSPCRRIISNSPGRRTSFSLFGFYTDLKERLGKQLWLSGIRQ